MKALDYIQVGVCILLVFAVASTFVTKVVVKSNESRMHVIGLVLFASGFIPPILGTQLVYVSAVMEKDYLDIVIRIVIGVLLAIIINLSRLTHLCVKLSEKQ